MVEYVDFGTEKDENTKLDSRTIKELAEAHSAASLKALARIVEDVTASPSAQVAAATLLLAYAHGKPAGEEGHGADKGVRMTMSELVALRDTLQRALPAPGGMIIDQA